MKKLLFTFVMLFITLFLLWFLMMWINHPNDFQYYHLDLLSTFNLVDKLSNNSLINGNDFYNTLSEFKKSVNEVINNGLLLNMLKNSGVVDSDTSFILEAIISLVSPISSIFTVVTVVGYLIVLVIEFVFIGIVVLIGLLDVIFNPVLIYYNPNEQIFSICQVGLEKATNLFGFAFQVPTILI